ncbi:MAG: hypothetical protein ABIN97_09830 [Ginsengibacter sp.]
MEVKNKQITIVKKASIAVHIKTGYIIFAPVENGPVVQWIE